MNLTDYLRKIAAAQCGLLKCTLVLPNGDEIPCRDDDQAQLLTSLWWSYSDPLVQNRLTAATEKPPNILR